MAQVLISDTSCGHVWVNVKDTSGNQRRNGIKLSGYNNETKDSSHDPPLLDLRSLACVDTHKDVAESRKGILSLQEDRKSARINSHIYRQTTQNLDENMKKVHRNTFSLLQPRQPTYLPEHRFRTHHLLNPLELERRGNISSLPSLPGCVTTTQPATSNDDDAVDRHAPLNVSVYCASAGLTQIPYPLPPTTQNL